MKRNYEHSREDVRAIQNSFRRHLAQISATISPDHLLQAANSQRRDIFQLFREELEEQKADIEPHKSYLRGTVPPHYQQDLEETFLSAGAVAMATSSTPKERPMSGTQQPHMDTPALPLKVHCIVCLVIAISCSYWVHITEVSWSALIPQYTSMSQCAWNW